MATQYLRLDQEHAADPDVRRLQQIGLPNVLSLVAHCVATDAQQHHGAAAQERASVAAELHALAGRLQALESVPDPGAEAWSVEDVLRREG
jgi:hypothetical protein